MVEGIIIGEVKTGKVIIARKNYKAKDGNPVAQQPDPSQSQYGIQQPQQEDAQQQANDFLADANHMSRGYELLYFVLKQYKHNPNALLKQDCRVFDHENGRILVCTVFGGSIVFIAVGNQNSHNELALQEVLRVTLVGTKLILKANPSDVEIVKHLGKVAKLLDEILFEEGFGVGTLRSTYDVKKTKVFEDITE